MDFEQLMAMYVRIVIQVLPLGVAFASGRRLLMSRSLNSVLYAFVFMLALAGVLAAAPGLFTGQPLEPAGIVVALLAAPAWAVVREICRRPEDEDYQMPVRPSFASSREREIRAPLLLSAEMRRVDGAVVPV